MSPTVCPESALNIDYSFSSLKIILLIWFVWNVLLLTLLKNSASIMLFFNVVFLPFHSTVSVPASEEFLFLLSSVIFLPAGGEQSFHLQRVGIQTSAITAAKPAKLGALALLKLSIGSTLVHRLSFTRFFFSFPMKYSSVALSVIKIRWDSLNCSPDWPERILIGGKQF